MIRLFAILGLMVVLTACSSPLQASVPAESNWPTDPVPVTGRLTATEVPSTLTVPPPSPQSTQVPSEEAFQVLLPTIQEYDVPSGSHPHDVAPALDGGVWYTAQHSGELGYLDPSSGETRHIPLGRGSSPHGVIVGPDGAPWITDGGLNGIVRVDPATEEVQVFPLPAGVRDANLNTATFDAQGILWFTGQLGYYGRLDPANGEIVVYQAPKGRGPYGITTTPDGTVYFVSLGNNYLASIDPATGEAAVLEPPTPKQGARRVWADSVGRLWISEWYAGQVGMYDPASNTWKEWKLPGDQPLAYAVYVDENDMVWLSDFGANALVRFNPQDESFELFPLTEVDSNVRQLHGREGEVWGAESRVDKLVVIRTKSR